MFGMGFTEILIIVVIAIIFLGPDKLPSTMIDIAKFFKNAKNTIGSVKETLEEEINMSDIKREALEYKASLDKATSSLNKVTDIQSHINDGIDSLTDTIDDDHYHDDHDDEGNLVAKKAPQESQEVTFKKKKKKIEEENSDV